MLGGNFSTPRARISEITNLKWKDIDFLYRKIKLFGKGSKERIVPIPETLKNYLEIINNKNDYIIHSSRDRNEVTRQFRKYANQIGLSNFTFHNLRDTYASWMVQRGVSLKVIQELLGHESIQTTMIYAHLAPEENMIASKIINSIL